MTMRAAIAISPTTTIPTINGTRFSGFWSELGSAIWGECWIDSLEKSTEAENEYSVVLLSASKNFCNRLWLCWRTSCVTGPIDNGVMTLEEKGVKGSCVTKDWGSVKGDCVTEDWGSVKGGFVTEDWGSVKDGCVKTDS